VRLGDRADDRQPQAGAATPPRAGALAPVEGLEEMFLIGGGDPFAVVAYHERDRQPIRLRHRRPPDTDDPVRVGVLRGVHDQVVERALEEIGIGGEGEGRAGIERDGPPLGQSPRLTERIGQEMCQLEFLSLHRQGRIEARQVEQLLGQASQPRDIAVHPL